VLQVGAPGLDRAQQLRYGARRMGSDHAGVHGRVRVDADDGLTVQVLRDVCHEPGRSNGHHDVARAKQEAVQVGALDPRTAPVIGNAGEDVLERAGLRLVAAGRLVNRAAARLQEEPRLLARPVAREQRRVLGGSTDDHDARDGRGDHRS
jgi:hypothetical protein